MLVGPKGSSPKLGPLGGMHPSEPATSPTSRVFVPHIQGPGAWYPALQPPDLGFSPGAPHGYRRGLAW